MDTANIIRQLDEEIARLQLARSLLVISGNPQPGPGRPRKRNQTSSIRSGRSKRPTERKLSAEGRARIAAAQKARWAKKKKGKEQSS